MADGGLLVPPTAQRAQAGEHVPGTLGAGHDVEGHRQRGLAADILHVQLGAGKLPLCVCLRLQGGQRERGFQLDGVRDPGPYAPQGSRKLRK